MDEALDETFRSGCQMVGLMDFRKRCAWLPMPEGGIAVGGDELAPFLFRPVMKLGAGPVRSVLLVGHHHCPESATAFQLRGIPVGIVPDREPWFREITGVEGKGNRGRPPHCLAIAAEAGLGVLADRVPLAPFLDRALAVGEGFFSALPGLDLALAEGEVVILVVDDGLVAAQPGLHELRRRDVMKFIGVHPEKPIARFECGARLMEHPATQTGFREVDGFLAERDHATVARGEIVDDLPGVVDASGIEHEHLVRPSKEVIEALADDVGLVADGKETDKFHECLLEPKAPFS